MSISEVAAETLREPYELEPETIERFRRDGFVRLRDVLAPEALDVLGDEITRRVFELNTEDMPIGERTAFRAAFLQVFNLWTHSDAAKELVFSPRLARIATELMGVRAVRLYHDQALYKEPGGKTTPWHADQYYWPFETPNTITAWIPFQAVPRRDGAALLQRRQPRVGDRARPPDQRGVGTRHRRRPSRAQASVCRGAVHARRRQLHYGWTFHRAPANTQRPSRGVFKRSSTSTPTPRSPSRRATPSARISSGGWWDQAGSARDG